MSTLQRFAIRTLFSAYSSTLAATRGRILGPLSFSALPTWRSIDHTCCLPSTPISLLACSTRPYASERRNIAVDRLNAAKSRRDKLQQAKASRKSEVTETKAQPTSTTTSIQPIEEKASDVHLSKLLDHNALVITRPIEWGTVIFGFEQANKYQVYDQDGVCVALLAEDMTGFGNEIGRQLLRTRRSFTATVLSADGARVLFRVKRPAYLLTSSMVIEDGAGNPVGEVHRRWHLLRRCYDLYMHKRQFAEISGPMLTWEFELKDDSGGTLALIDRNFQGFGKELFTDAGKYVIHFGSKAGAQATNQPPQSPSVPPATPPSPAPPAADVGPVSVTPMAQLTTGVTIIPTSSGNQLVVARPLTLDERMVVLAAAISVDYDFFSQHSHSGGWFHPMILPMPMPSGGQAAPGEGAGQAGVDGGAGAAGAAAAGGADSMPGGNDSELGDGTQVANDDNGGWQWDAPGGAESAGDDGKGVLGTLWEVFNDGE